MNSDSNKSEDGGINLIRSWAVLREDAMSSDKAAAGTLAGPSRRFLAPERGPSGGDYDGKNNNMEEVGTSKDVISVKENCTDNEDKGLCRLLNVEISGFSDINIKDVADGTSECKRDKTINVPFPTRLPRNTHCNHNNSNAEEINSRSKERKASEVAEALVGSSSTEVSKNKSNVPLPIPALPLRQEKGKEKALSDDSAESCNNSVVLYSKGVIKRQRDDDGGGLMVQSKRVKKQTKVGSSFMEWISNMVKVPERSAVVKGHSSSLSLTKSYNYSRVSKTGFQTMFQSMYCRNMDMLSNGVRDDNDNNSIEESKQLIENLPDRKSDNSCKQIDVVSEKEVKNPAIDLGQSSRPWIFSTDVSGNISCDRAKDVAIPFPIPSDSLGKKVNSTEEKQSPENVNPLNSLWITQFSTRTPGLETGHPKSNTEDVERDKNFPLFDIASANDRVAPSGIFHAIRNLRLSRSDILRWMNSDVSLSNLNGFFLRLRMGKVEGGKEAASYYVACITGEAGGKKGSRSKKSILVDVGGMKSSVESRYVSNHDFLEDEIMSWWCRTVESGCPIPSLEELNLKFIERKSIGF